jgi:hypothetical protein
VRQNEIHFLTRNAAPIFRPRLASRPIRNGNAGSFTASFELRALKVKLTSSSSVFALLPHEDFGFHSAAVRAFEAVHYKVRSSCVGLDNSQL